jgi:hypothetical protein
MMSSRHRMSKVPDNSGQQQADHLDQAYDLNIPLESQGFKSVVTKMLVDLFAPEYAWEFNAIKNSVDAMKSIRTAFTAWFEVVKKWVVATYTTISDTLQQWAITIGTAVKAIIQAIQDGAISLSDYFSTLELFGAPPAPEYVAISDELCKPAPDPQGNFQAQGGSVQDYLAMCPLPIMTGVATSLLWLGGDLKLPGGEAAATKFQKTISLFTSLERMDPGLMMKRFFNFIYHAITGRDVWVEFEASREFATVTKELSEKLRELETLLNPPSILQEQVTELYLRLERAYPCMLMNGSKVDANVTKLYQFLSNKANPWASSFKGSLRMKPVVICMSGDSGVGKTRAQKALINHIPKILHSYLAVDGQMRKDLPIYVDHARRPSSFSVSCMAEKNKFDDGYMDPLFYCFEEYLTSKIESVKTSWSNHFMQCIDDQPFMLNMAFGDKGKKFFNSPFVIATGNYTNHHVMVEKPQAYHRRIEFDFVVKRGEVPKGENYDPCLHAKFYPTREMIDVLNSTVSPSSALSWSLRNVQHGHFLCYQEVAYFMCLVYLERLHLFNLTQQPVEYVADEKFRLHMTQTLKERGVDSIPDGINVLFKAAEDRRQQDILNSLVKDPNASSDVNPAFIPPSVKIADAFNALNEKVEAHTKKTNEDAKAAFERFGRGLAYAFSSDKEGKGKDKTSSLNSQSGCDFMRLPTLNSEGVPFTQAENAARADIVYSFGLKLCNLTSPKLSNWICMLATRSGLYNMLSYKDNSSYFRMLDWRPQIVCNNADNPWAMFKAFDDAIGALRVWKSNNTVDTRKKYNASQWATFKKLFGKAYYYWYATYKSLETRPNPKDEWTLNKKCFLVAVPTFSTAQWTDFRADFRKQNPGADITMRGNVITLSTQLKQAYNKRLNDNNVRNGTKPKRREGPKAFVSAAQIKRADNVNAKRGTVTRDKARDSKYESQGGNSYDRDPEPDVDELGRLLFAAQIANGDPTVWNPQTLNFTSEGYMHYDAEEIYYKDLIVPDSFAEENPRQRGLELKRRYYIEVMLNEHYTEESDSEYESQGLFGTTLCDKPNFYEMVKANFRKHSTVFDQGTIDEARILYAKQPYSFRYSKGEYIKLLLKPFENVDNIQGREGVRAYLQVLMFMGLKSDKELSDGMMYSIMMSNRFAYLMEQDTSVDPIVRFHFSMKHWLEHIPTHFPNEHFAYQWYALINLVNFEVRRQDLQVYGDLNNAMVSMLLNPHCAPTKAAFRRAFGDYIDDDTEMLKHLIEACKFITLTTGLEIPKYIKQCFKNDEFNWTNFAVEMAISIGVLAVLSGGISMLIVGLRKFIKPSKNDIMLQIAEAQAKLDALKEKLPGAQSFDFQNREVPTRLNVEKILLQRQAKAEAKLDSQMGSSSPQVCKVKGNQYAILANGSLCGDLVFLSGQIAVLNSHVWNSLPENFTLVPYVPLTNVLLHRVTKSEVTVLEEVVTGDRCCIRVPRVRPHSSIYNHFMTSEEINSFVQANAGCVSTYVGGNVMTPTVDVVSNVQYIVQPTAINSARPYNLDDYMMYTWPGAIKSACGTLLFLTVKGQIKIAGMHTAGKTDHKVGVATPMSFEYVHRFNILNNTKTRHPMLNQLEDNATIAFVEKGDTYKIDTTLDAHSISTQHITQATDSTCFVSTEFQWHKFDGGAPKVPVGLTNEAYQKARDKEMLIYPVDYQQDAVDIVRDYTPLMYEKLYGGVDISGCQTLTAREALGSYENLKPFDKNTSKGLRLRTWNMSKKNILEQGDHYEPFIQMIEQRVSEMKNEGSFEYQLCVDKGKDELRDLERVAAKKMRVFKIADFVDNVYLKMAMGDLINKTKHLHWATPATCGIDPGSSEWRLIANLFENEDVLCTDISGFESTVSDLGLPLIIYIIRKAYSERWSRRFAVYVIMAILYAIRFNGGKGFILGWQNTSGNWLTTWFNTVTNLMYFCIVVIKGCQLFGDDPYEAIRELKIKLYSDDNLVALKRAWFTSDFVVTQFKRMLNVTVTATDKGDDISLMSIWHCEFLSRGFRLDNGQVFCPLAYSSLISQLYFVRCPKNERSNSHFKHAQLQQNLDNVARELREYPKDQAFVIATKIMEFIKKHKLNYAFNYNYDEDFVLTKLLLQ